MRSFFQQRSEKEGIASFNRATQIFNEQFYRKMLSKFELLKCCRIFQQRSDRLRTLEGAAQIPREQPGHLRLSSELQSI